MKPIINGPFTFLHLSGGVWVMGYGLQVVGTQGIGADVSAAQLVRAFDTMRTLFVEQHKALLDDDSRAWIGAMLAPQVMTQTAADWRAPTPWEVRHVAGTGSFSRMSMQRGSELVGVNLQTFKRYASEGPKAHSISFAAWHLLLHRLGVQLLPAAPIAWSG